MKRMYEIISITVLFLLICFVYKGQPRISYHGGQGWDGVRYYNIPNKFYMVQILLSGKFLLLKDRELHS